MKPSPPLVFQAAGPGVEHATFDSGSFAGHALRLDLRRVDVRLLPAGPVHRTVDTIAAGAPWYVAINASFFDEHGKAMGRAVDQGSAQSLDRRSPWGALVINDGQARILLGKALPAAQAGGDLVVQGIPRLVVAGEVPKLKPASAVRTAACADDDELLLVVTTTPADTTDFARFLALPADKGGLGCKDALNLDGGPSTQLHVRLPSLTLDVRGGWGVPNALVAMPKAERPDAPASPGQPPSGAPADAGPTAP